MAKFLYLLNGAPHRGVSRNDNFGLIRDQYINPSLALKGGKYHEEIAFIRTRIGVDGSVVCPGSG
jgi:hypothetical protein